MEYYRTDLFKDSYSRLDAEDKARIQGALRKLEKNPHAPFPRGMRVHVLKGVKGTPIKAGEKKPPVWEFHASRGLIITFQYGDGYILLRNCGQHDSVLQRP